jgi:hypothetical protein
VVERRRRHRPGSADCAGLGVCRSALGIGESAGVSAVGKLNAIYLKPEERALGAARQPDRPQLWAARWPPTGAVAAAVSSRMALALHGGRRVRLRLASAVVVCEPRASPPNSAKPNSLPVRNAREQAILRHLCATATCCMLVIGNLLWMGSYSLWSNWTTLYLIHVHHITLQQSKNYAWIPPLISNAGGFFGGWLSLRWAKKTADPIAARLRAVWVSALCSLITLALPFAVDARWATVLISASFFFALAGSVNIYALPIDIYGAKRSGMALAALTCSYGLLQSVISPIIGYLSDHKLYTQVIWLVTVPLILSALVLQGLKVPIEFAADSRR